MTHEEALIAWVRARNPDIGGEAVTETTPLVEQRLLTSLQLAEFLLFLEERRGRAIDVTQLEPGAFADVRTIVRRFLGDAR